ncbi:MAG: hypothetical protein Q7U57_03220 [Methylovulum sp.]|nr:hypothetical protein [Methylovulum sp.]
MKQRPYLFFNLWIGAGLLVLNAAVVVAAVPGLPVLLSPSGTITLAKPGYKWQPVVGSTDYKLVVSTAAGALLLNQTYTAAQAHCANEADICTVTPPTTLAIGKYTWKLRGKNSAGYGQQASKSFRRGVPSAPALVAPVGDITIATPTYRWNAVSGAAQYNLNVRTSAGTVIDQWYGTTQAGCPLGTGVCSVTPGTALKSTAHEWKVRAKNVLGNGAWSAVKAFNNVTGCNVALVPDNTSGGCYVRLVEPAACTEIDLTNGKTYLFGWTTDGSYCETPWRFYIAGNPANLVTGENIYWKDFSTDSSAGISHTGGLVRLSAAALDSLGLTSDNGVYHWVVVSWFGSHPASQTFRVKK